MAWSFICPSSRAWFNMAHAVVLKNKILNVFSPLHAFPLRKGCGISFDKKLESPKSKDPMCQVCLNWPSGVEMSPIYIFSLLIKMTWPFILNLVVSLLGKTCVACLLHSKSCQTGSGHAADSKMHYTIQFSILMLCAKYQEAGLCGSREKCDTDSDPYMSPPLKRAGDTTRCPWATLLTCGFLRIFYISFQCNIFLLLCYHLPLEKGGIIINKEKK